MTPSGPTGMALPHAVLALNVLSPTSLLAAAGALAVLLVAFAETGLLIGFFLPGDSLLFTAGLFCTTHAGGRVQLSLGWVLAAAAVGALTGAQVGFLLGRRAGPVFFERADRPRLRQGIERADHLFAKYGYGKAIVLARFIPVVRTVLNPLAGVVHVPTRVFTIWQVVGGLVWSLGVTLAGYGLGSSIHGIDHYLLPIIAVIVVISVIPLGLELLRAHRQGTDAPAHADRSQRAAEEVR
jgi:membrane-associated protein